MDDQTLDVDGKCDCLEKSKPTKVVFRRHVRCPVIGLIAVTAAVIGLLVYIIWHDIAAHSGHNVERPIQDAPIKPVQPVLAFPGADKFKETVTTQTTQATTPPARPNVVFVLVDDLGWDDVSYHGGGQIHTPAIDQLSQEGVRLENYYVQPTCSPTRIQLLTGRYQIRMGLSHGIIRPMQPKAVPLDEVMLPQRLRDLGYGTHMVGKWHLGHYRTEFLPHYRGFDTFFGKLLGSGDHFSHTRPFVWKTKKKGMSTSGPFVDLRDNNGPVWNERDHYSTHLFTERAIDVIKKQSAEKPFFLYVSHQAVHGPLQVPEVYTRMYENITDRHRRTLAGMVSAVDEGVANLTDALKAKGLWNNTVFIFSTDNGSHKPSKQNNGRNWPLRGGKASLFEGGVRGVGFVSGGYLTRRGVVSRELMHVSDWFPTIVRGLAGGKLDGGKPLDGYDQWRTIRDDTPSPRRVLLHNLDVMAYRRGQPLFEDTFDTSVRSALRVGEMKLLTGNPGEYREWIPPPDHRKYQVPATDDWRDKNLWLFNLTSDPYETVDLSDLEPGIVRSMLDLLVKFNETAVPPTNPKNDRRSNPRNLGGAWGPWL